MAEGEGEVEEGEEGFRTVDFSLGGRDLVVMRYVRVTALAFLPCVLAEGMRGQLEIGAPWYDSR